uniref:Uncharacterized protein n=1 Tax=Romanomermis culicivorax TaxID=13658 RepID=A0A915IA58_ROMCU
MGLILATVRQCDATKHVQDLLDYGNINHRRNLSLPRCKPSGIFELLIYMKYLSALTVNNFSMKRSLSKTATCAALPIH